MRSLTQPQVAAALGVSPTTVKRALAKALHGADAEALMVEGVVAGRQFSARRTVARGGEPWRFVIAGLDGGAARPRPSAGAGPATPIDSHLVEGPPAPSDAAGEIAWLRAEIERRDAALEREQLANAELHRLLLALSDRPPSAVDAASPAIADDLLATVERAAKEAGIGKKQRRALTERLGALAGSSG